MPTSLETIWLTTAAQPGPERLWHGPLRAMIRAAKRIETAIKNHPHPGAMPTSSFMVVVLMADRCAAPRTSGDREPRGVLGTARSKILRFSYKGNICPLPRL